MSKKKKKPITFQQFNKMINQFLTELKRKKKGPIGIEEFQRVFSNLMTSLIWVSGSGKQVKTK